MWGQVTSTLNSAKYALWLTPLRFHLRFTSDSMDAVAKRKQLKMAIRDGKSDFGFGFFMRERNCSSTLVLLNTRRTRVAKTWNYSEVRPSHKPQLCCIFPQVGKVVCGTMRWKSIGVVGMNEHRQCYCCNLSGGVVWFTTNGMCVKNNTIMYVARTSNNRVISSGDLYCCLLPRCEALRTCHSGFPIATLPQASRQKSLDSQKNSLRLKKNH